MSELEAFLKNIEYNNDPVENAEKLLEITADLNEIFRIIESESVINKTEVLNTLAVIGFQNNYFDILIPLLQKSLQYDSQHKDTLMNLSIILAHVGEIDLAIKYALRIEEKNEDVIEWLDKLGFFGTGDSRSDILGIEQNNVKFTGERLVINQEVKEKYNDVLEEHLERYKLACQYSEGKDVLDAACGAGYGSKMLQQAGARSVYGVDVSNESIQNAQATYGSDNITFSYGNVNGLQFADKSFDLVVSFETIEHIDDGALWIKESARVLRDDGIFLVSTPNRLITNPGTYFVERPLNPHHRFEYSVLEFVGELTKEYDVIELYGQTFKNDHESYFGQVMRKARNLNLNYIPRHDVQFEGYQLVPLGDVKDAQPMYITAVCRKKKKLVSGGDHQGEGRKKQSIIPVTRETLANQFFSLGENSYIAADAEIVGAEAITIGNNVIIKKGAWLNIALNNFLGEARITIEDGCEIGKNFTISVANKATIEKYVIVGPNVYIADCGHTYENIAVPIMYQGVTSTSNTVVVGEGSWLGVNSVIVGNVHIGRGCVVAANSFVNKSIPDFSVVAGNPARVVKMFDPLTMSWAKTKDDAAVEKMLKQRVDHPLISICIPTYNRANDLRKCLESIYTQIGDSKLFEVYISNNASPDNTEEVVSYFQREYGNITYNKNNHNIGADKNVALTMQKSKGKFMLMHGDDDFFNPGLFRTILSAILTYRECGIFFLNVLNDNKEVKVYGGMEEFIKNVSIGSGFISSIIVSREEFNKLKDPFKFVDLSFNQIYLQLSILENNPNFCLINDSSFTYAGNEPLGYNFGEVFIKNYLDILNFFKGKGLSEELIKEDKLRILKTTVLPWFRRIHEFKLNTDISNFDFIFDEYYADEHYYKEVKALIRDIKRQYS